METTSCGEIPKSTVARSAREAWTSPRPISQTSDTSDHPLLVTDGRRTYLSWMTKADGYRFIPIEGLS